MGRGDEETSDGWQISGSRISGKYYEMTIGQRGNDHFAVERSWPLFPWLFAEYPPSEVARSAK